MAEISRHKPSAPEELPPLDHSLLDFSPLNAILHPHPSAPMEETWHHTPTAPPLPFHPSAPFEGINQAAHIFQSPFASTNHRTNQFVNPLLQNDSKPQFSLIGGHISPSAVVEIVPPSPKKYFNMDSYMDDKKGEERTHPFFQKQQLYEKYLFASAAEQPKKSLFSISSKIEKKKKETITDKKFFHLSSPPKVNTSTIKRDEKLHLNPKCQRIFKQYSEFKKPYQSLQTLAKDLSNVMGYTIAKGKANHQLHQYNKIKEDQKNFEESWPNKAKRKYDIIISSPEKKKIKKSDITILQKLKEMKEQFNEKIDDIASYILKRKKQSEVETSSSETSKFDSPQRDKSFQQSDVDIPDPLSPKAEESRNPQAYSSGDEDFKEEESSDAGPNADMEDNVSEDSEDHIEKKQVKNFQPQISKNEQIDVDYVIANNSKLQPTMVVTNRNDEIYTYTKKSTSKNKQIVYYVCNRCPRGAYASRGTMKDKKFTVQLTHSAKCKGPLTKDEFDILEIERKGREQMAKGFKPIEVYDVMYKEATEKKIQDKLPMYENMGKIYSRVFGRRIPPSVRGNVHEAHKILLDGNRWLLYEDDEVQVFASDLALTTLAKCKIVDADATFYTCPRTCRQVLYMHGLVETKNGAEWRPLVMAPMKEKNEECYKKVMDAIKKRWDELKIKPEIDRIHADYEIALRNALEKLVGKEKVFGCLFHYDQAVIRKLSKVGLSGYYMQAKYNRSKNKQNKEIRRWFRLILALPMLPREDITLLWEQLKKEKPQKPKDYKEEWPQAGLDKMETYMETEWMPLLQEDGNNSWCFFNMGRVKNINAAEGYHSGLKVTLPKKPKYRILLEKQKQRFSWNDTRLHKLQNDEKIKVKDVNKDYAQLANDIAALEKEFTLKRQQDLTEDEVIALLKTHCRKISYLLHDVRNKSGITTKSAKLAEKRKEKGLIATSDESEISSCSDEESPAASKSKKSKKKVKESEKDKKEKIADTVKGSKEKKNQKSGEVGSKQKTKKQLKDEDTKDDKSNKKKNENSKFNVNDENDNKSKPKIKKQESDEKFSSAKEEKGPKKNDIKLKKVKKTKKKQKIKDGDESSEVEAVFEGPANTKKLQQRIREHHLMYFNPPSEAQIQEYLRILGLPPRLAANSPLLPTRNSTYADEFLQVFDVQSDGNCGYRAISFLLTGREDFHWLIRHKTYEFLIKNGVDHIGMLEKDVERYKEKYATLKKYKGPRRVGRELYAGNDDFYGLSKLLKVNIKMRRPTPYGHDFEAHYIERVDGEWKEKEDLPTLFIDYVNGNHFRAITQF